MAKVICRAYSAGVFHGIEFREAVVGGHLVGVAEVTDPTALDWFRARRRAFIIEGDPGKAKPKAKGKGKGGAKAAPKAPAPEAPPPAPAGDAGGQPEGDAPPVDDPADGAGQE